MEENFRVQLQSLLTKLLLEGKLIETNQQVEISIRNNEEVDREALESVLGCINSKGFKKKITNFLQVKGITKLSAVTLLTPLDLLKHRGLGQKSVKVFAQALLQSGAQMDPEWRHSRWLSMSPRNQGYD